MEAPRCGVNAGRNLDREARRLEAREGIKGRGRSGKQRPSPNLRMKHIGIYYKKGPNLQHDLTVVQVCLSKPELKELKRTDLAGGVKVCLSQQLLCQHVSATSLRVKATWISLN